MAFLQSRELVFTIVWKEHQQMCAVKFLRLEDLLYDNNQSHRIDLEPQGVLFADVCTTFSLSPEARKYRVSRVSSLPKIWS